MAKTIRIIALGILLLSVAVWIATGAHRGWTKTSVDKVTIDEVTGIEGHTQEKRFVAGVDFLGAAAAGAAVLAGISLFLKPKQKH